MDCQWSRSYKGQNSLPFGRIGYCFGLECCCCFRHDFQQIRSASVVAISRAATYGAAWPRSKKVVRESAANAIRTSILFKRVSGVCGSRRRRERNVEGKVEAKTEESQRNGKVPMRRDRSEHTWLYIPCGSRLNQAVCIPASRHLETAHSSLLPLKAGVQHCTAVQEGFIVLLPVFHGYSWALRGRPVCRNHVIEVMKRCRLRVSWVSK